MNAWNFGLFLCCIGLICLQIRNESKLHYQQGIIEGMQKIERSKPQINVTQTNEFNGVKK